MTTLSGIASSFGELSRRVEKNGMGGGRERVLGSIGFGMEGQGEERDVEPVMRELQVLAPSVSRESVTRTGVDEFDEDDGGSILL